MVGDLDADPIIHVRRILQGAISVHRTHTKAMAYRRLSIILLTLAVWGGSSAFAQGARKREAALRVSPQGPPSRPPLKPRDDAADNPGFLTFRQQVQSAVVVKDKEAMVRIVDPAIQLDFEPARRARRN